MLWLARYDKPEPNESCTSAACRAPGRFPFAPLLDGYGRSDHRFGFGRRLSKRDVDPGAAAPACLAIAGDGKVGDEVRLSAAEQLAALDPSA